MKKLNDYTELQQIIENLQQKQEIEDCFTKINDYEIVREFSKKAPEIFTNDDKFWEKVDRLKKEKSVAEERIKVILQNLKNRKTHSRN